MCQGCWYANLKMLNYNHLHYFHVAAHEGSVARAAEKLGVTQPITSFPAWFWDFRGIALFQARRYEETIQSLSRLTTLYRWDHYYRAASYAHLGLIDRARACGAEVLRLRPAFTIAEVAMTEAFKEPAELEHLLQGLRKAGLPE